MALILGSCGSSNNVVSNGLIQKRKYNKGFFLKSNGQFKTAKADVKDEKMYSVSEEVTVLPKQEMVSAPVLAKQVVVAQSIQKQMNEAIQASVSTRTTLTSKSSAPAHFKTIQNVESRKEVRKEVRQELKHLRKKESSSSAADGYTILLVILAIIIPPLAVGLFEGITVRFWIDLILALLGWGLLGWLFPGLIWLGGLAAIIYALLIVLSVI